MPSLLYRSTPRSGRPESSSCWRTTLTLGGRRQIPCFVEHPMLRFCRRGASRLWARFSRVCVLATHDETSACQVFFASCYASGRITKEKRMSTKLSGSACGRWFICILAAGLLIASSSNLSAGQNQKNKKSKDASTTAQAPLGPPPPELEQIDHDIGEMLAGFQIGDVEMMHKYYADTVTFVSGDWSPAVIGWQKLRAALSEAARGVSGSAADPAKHVDFGARRFRMGDVPVGIRFHDGQRTAISSLRADNFGVQQGRRGLADRAQPHVAGCCRTSASICAHSERSQALSSFRAMPVPNPPRNQKFRYP